MVAATTTPGHHHVRDLDEEEDDNHLQNGDTSRDLRMDSDDIVGKLWFKKVSFHKDKIGFAKNFSIQKYYYFTQLNHADPVDERQTLAERNLRLQDQLRSLKEDLSHIRDDTGETTMDRIHKENVKQGRDKYKTLREVRKGNTKRRVDQFENM